MISIKILNLLKKQVSLVVKIFLKCKMHLVDANHQDQVILINQIYQGLFSKILGYLKIKVKEEEGSPHRK